MPCRAKAQHRIPLPAAKEARGQAASPICSPHRTKKEDPALPQDPLFPKPKHQYQPRQGNNNPEHPSQPAHPGRRPGILRYLRFLRDINTIPPFQVNRVHPNLSPNLNRLSPVPHASPSPISNRANPDSITSRAQLNRNSSDLPKRITHKQGHTVPLTPCLLCQTSCLRHETRRPSAACATRQ